MVKNRVLIADDDDDSVLETYQTILTGSAEQQELLEVEQLVLNGEEGEPATDVEYELLFCSSGEEAIRQHAESLSRGERIAVALLDMRMPPGMDGLNTAVALRKQDQNINIVIITAYSDYNVDEIQEALEHDFILLSKPVETEEFRQITRNAIISYYRLLHLKETIDFPLDSVQEEVRGSAGKILLVDNDPVAQQFCAALLKQQCGYELHLLQSGEEVLQQVEAIQPDLILLDVMMPGLNGYETCARLKLMPGVSAIPVIFMTALSAEKDVVSCFQVGGVDYVSKPFSQEILLARVAVHLKQYRARSSGDLLSKNRLLKVLGSLSEGVLMTDRYGVITEVNGVVERMAHQHSDQLLGQQISSLFASNTNGIDFILNGERLAGLEQQLQQLLQQRPLYFEQVINDAPLGIIQVEAESGQMLHLNYRVLQLLQGEYEAFEGRAIEQILPQFPELQEAACKGEVSQQLTPEAGELLGLPVMVSVVALETIEERRCLIVIVRQQEYELDATLMHLTTFGQFCSSTAADHNEWYLKQGSGELFPVMLQGGVYRDEYHHIEGGIVTLMDLRERKRAESQEQHAAFHSGVAEMSSNILHNIGNSLQGVSTGVSQLKDQQQQFVELIENLEKFNQSDLTPEQRAAREHDIIQKLPEVLGEAIRESGNHYSEMSSIELVEHGVEHIRDIIQLHRKGGKADQQAVRCDLYQLLDDALMIIGGRFSKQGITLTKELTLEDAGCLVPRNQLLQAIINLLVNAAESIAEQFSDPREGVVSIELSSAEQQMQRYISIVVADNGVGITAEQREKILEFGYSTKQRGSGFGLHATAHFLRAIEGELQIESRGEGHGARFTLLIPVDQR